MLLFEDCNLVIFWNDPLAVISSVKELMYIGYKMAWHSFVMEATFFKVLTLKHCFSLAFRSTSESSSQSDTVR